MKRTTLCGTALIMASATLAQAPSSPTPQQQIQPLLHEMDTAANAHDTDRFMAPFQHTDRLVFVINGHVIHGWTALRDQQRQWWLNGKTDVVYTPKGASEFTVLRPDLVAVTRVFSSSRTASDGQAAKWDFAVSMIWQKLPEGWRIVYDHESRTP